MPRVFRPHVRTALVIALAVAAALHVAAAASDPVSDAAVAAIRTLDLQSTIPHDPALDQTSRPWTLPLPRELIWVAAAALAAILIYALRDIIPGLRRAPDNDTWATEAGRFGTAPRSAGASLAAADLLAGQGRFVEAMHLLLLYSLTELRRGLRVDFADSLTSREILRAAPLAEAGRGALTGIVARVEESYFGDHPAGAPDYAFCREGFVALQDSFARAGAA